MSHLPFLLFGSLLLSPLGTSAVTTYTLDTAKLEPRTDDPVPGAGGKGADGVVYSVTRNGFYRDGAPWYPVSGEYHYVRADPATWNRELAKTRAGGVDILATYVFWNHHEKTPGVWDWSGRRDLRTFLNLAQANGLKVWLRVGPYINAETNNGGIPDFALKGKRSNNAEYLAKTDAYLAQVAKQTEGLFVKDGGPIVGIQIENEFASGDPAHITKLREMFVAHGLIAPVYSITANTRFTRNTAVPLQGGYVYRGWQEGGGKGAVPGFIFGSDEWTANTDLGGAYYQTLDYPRGFAEMGTGSPMRGGNRFLVEPKHVLATAYDAVGRGCNLLGYYMYHGGTQVEGLGSGWPLTYDFQAPLGEFGRERESYRHYRRLHTFLATFADEIVPTRISRDPGQRMDPTQTGRLRYIGRFGKNGRGFVFVNNTQRGVTMKPQKDFQIRIADARGDIVFPATPMTLPTDRYGVFPIRSDLAGVELVWATVHPFAKITNPGDIPTFVYRTTDWTDNELAFTKGTKISPESSAPPATRETDGKTIVSADAGHRHVWLVGKAGTTAPAARIIVLRDAESLDAVVTTVDGKQRLVIAPGSQISAVFPGLRFSGVAGSTVMTEIFPASGLKPTAAWKKTHAAGVFAAFSSPLAAAPAAPTLTPAGKGEWKISGSPASWKDLAEARFEIGYLGGEATLLSEGKAISNDLWHDESWSLDLKYFGGRPLTVRISDWTKGIAGVTKPSGPMPVVTGVDWKPSRDVSWSAE